MICGKRQIGAIFLGLAQVVGVQAGVGGFDDFAHRNLRESVLERANQIGPYAAVGDVDGLWNRQVLETGIAQRAQILRRDTAVGQVQQFLDGKFSPAGFRDGTQKLGRYTAVAEFDNCVDRKIAISGGDQGGQERSVGRALGPFGSCLRLLGLQLSLHREQLLLLRLQLRCAAASARDCAFCACSRSLCSRGPAALA